MYPFRKIIKKESQTPLSPNESVPRVSTIEQAEKGYSIGVQTEKLKSYCFAYGCDVYVSPYKPSIIIGGKQKA